MDQDSPNLIEIASRLARIKSNGCHSPDTEETIRQIANARSKSRGLVVELLSAVQNFLSCLTEGTLGYETDALSVLSEVSRMLNTAHPTGQLPEGLKDDLDVLLERLDFLASGGTDNELPRGQTTATTSIEKTSDVKFPIDVPDGWEDPNLVSSLVKFQSAADLVRRKNTSEIVNSTDEIFSKQKDWQDSLVSQIEKQTKLPFETLAERVEDEITRNINNLDIEIDHSLSPAVILEGLFKSLALRLLPLIGRGVRAFALVSPSPCITKISVSIDVGDSDVDLCVHALDLETKFVEEYWQKITSLDSVLPFTFERNSKPADQHPMWQIKNDFVQLGGDLGFEVTSSESFSMKFSFPRFTRFTSLVEVSICGCLMGIEAHLVHAIISVTQARWESGRLSILHKGKLYERAEIDTRVLRHQASLNESGYLILLESNGRRLALHADTVETTGEGLIHRSSSRIEFGHSILGYPRLMVLIDPDSIGYDYSELQPTTLRDSTPRFRVCLHDLSMGSIEKFDIATRNLSVECVVTNEEFDVIRDLQEHHPKMFFVEQQHDSNFLEKFDLLEQADGCENVKLVALVNDDEVATSFEVPKNSSLHLIRKGITPEKLASFIQANLRA